MRRLGDLVIACIALAITFPLMLIVGLAIRLETPGPTFARQNCIGSNGRRFQMLKFRTRVHSPEHSAPPRAEEMTRVGSYLQYTRVEDLPQLFNVLRGEMSIIDSSAHSPSFLD
jgi:lipopolysaccharide/colanic/teichoic acid biosynthesis glycosyltransferase